jgi:general secretion pathway protein A
MVLDYYNLKEQPFGVTPDPRYLYLSPTHREALASLSYGIRSGRGFLSIIAKPGMGKTTILFHLLNQLEGSARIVFLFQTLCGPQDLLRGLLRKLGIVNNTGDMVHMQAQLEEVLLTESHHGRKVIVVIDEAQNLEDSALELVRMLSNFENPTDKLMQIVLGGQPQLSHKLASPHLLQLRQRMSIFARLRLFDAEETHLYIEHRLRVAGYNFQTPLFTPQAEALIAKHSDGIPRNINNICFNALSLGCVLKQKSIQKEVIREVLDDLDLETEESAGRSLIGWRTVRHTTVFPQAFSWRKRLAAFVVLLLPLVLASGQWHRPKEFASDDSLPAHSGILHIDPKLLTAAVTTDGQNPTGTTAHGEPQLKVESVLKSAADRTLRQGQTISQTRVLQSRQPPRPDVAEILEPSKLWAQVKSGNSDAEIELARMYLQGTEVPQNCAQAQILLLTASRKGNARAADLLSNSTNQCR